MHALYMCLCVYVCICDREWAFLYVRVFMRTWVRAYKCKNACVNMFSYF